MFCLPRGSRTYDILVVNLRPLQLSVHRKVLELSPVALALRFVPYSFFLPFLAVINAIIRLESFVIAIFFIVPDSVYSIFATLNLSEHLNLSLILVMSHLSLLIQINGAVYSSRPIPQLVQARLKLSLARPFSASVLDFVRYVMTDWHENKADSFLLPDHLSPET